MRIFKTRWLTRFARREGVADVDLRDAIERAERGLIDADLGGRLIKQRVARRGGGKSGGYRMLVAYRTGDRAIFLFGFAKSDVDNIGAHQLDELRELGGFWLDADEGTVGDSLATAKITEISHDEG